MSPSGLASDEPADSSGGASSIPPAMQNSIGLVECWIIRFRMMTVLAVLLNEMIAELQTTKH
jgi:hypothetical protein